MRTKIPYSPPTLEVVKLKVNRCICITSPQQTINQLMLLETFDYENGDWEDPDWDY